MASALARPGPDYDSPGIRCRGESNLPARTHHADHQFCWSDGFISDPIFSLGWMFTCCAAFASNKAVPVLGSSGDDQLTIRRGRSA